MPTPHPGWLDDPAPYRAEMVRDLVARGAIRSRGCSAAFEESPRELFVPGHALRGGVASVYRNEVLVTMTDTGGPAVSSSSKPQLMAAMPERLDVRHGAAVLEVGTGAGYKAALLRRLVGPPGWETSSSTSTWSPVP
jgi:protein-L-isoaspartate(D-aspartate) O-methyltransferase